MRLALLRSVAGALLITVCVGVAPTFASGFPDFREVGFSPARFFPYTGTPSYVAVDDFDSDGTKDVAVAAQLPWNDDATRPPIAMSVLRGDGAGQLGAESQYLSGRAFWLSLVSADVNGDQDPDLVTARAGGGDNGLVSALFGSAEGSFLPGSLSIPTESPASVISTDLNADGRSDLVLTEARASVIRPYVASTSGSLIEATPVSTGTPRSLGAAGDVDGDGKMDLALVGGGGATVELGDGAGGFAEAGTVALPPGTVGVALGDFNADGKADLLGFGPTVSLWLATDHGYETSQSYVVSGPPGAVALADINRDGHLDAVTLGRNDGTVNVLIGDGQGGLPQRTAVPLAGGRTAGDLAVADMDGDGLKDVVVPVEGQVAVLRNSTDVDPPGTTLEAGPSTARAIAEHAPAFSFSSRDPDVVGFVCALDGARAATCRSPHVASYLADGHHTFSVAAVDASGNRDPTPASTSLDVDTVAPTTTITVGPKPSVVHRKASLSFSTSEPAMTECRLDDQDWSTCRSPWRAVVTRGSHVLAVRATDAAGNVERAFPERRWTVQRMTPSFRVSGTTRRMRVNGAPTHVLKTLSVSGAGAARVQPVCPRCQRLAGAVRVSRGKGVVRFHNLNLVVTSTTRLRVIVVAPDAIARYQSLRWRMGRLHMVESGCLDRRLKPMGCG